MHVMSAFVRLVVDKCKSLVPRAQTDCSIRIVRIVEKTGRDVERTFFVSSIACPGVAKSKALHWPALASSTARTSCVRVLRRSKTLALTFVAGPWLWDLGCGRDGCVEQCY